MGVALGASIGPTGVAVGVSVGAVGVGTGTGVGALRGAAAEAASLGAPCVGATGTAMAVGAVAPNVAVVERALF
jgi:hypothetical protein